MCVRAASLFILLLAPDAWGLISENLADQLAEDPKWLNLGHYEKTWFGYRSPLQGVFFLDPKGHRNPKSELKATIDAFLNPSEEQLHRLKMHPQCFYGARFRFLKPYLELTESQVEKCSDRVEWKHRLHATAVTAIFAASDMNSGPSSFGHLFLKLKNPENAGHKELIDYGLNYAADADRNEGIFYAIKGLFGFYGGRFTLLPFHRKLREYTNVEGRDLWEYPLNFSPEETEDLIDHLLELDGAFAPYYFLSNNCAYQIARALEAVRPSLKISQKLPPWVIPLDVLKLMDREPGLIQPGIYHRSLKSEYLASLRTLSTTGREALDSVEKNLTWPSQIDLSKEEKAAVFDAAMKHLALKSYQSGSDLGSDKYKLSVARARLGIPSKDVAQVTPPPPEKSHDSGGVAVGRGHAESGGGYQSLKIKQAFHDITQEGSGAAKFSHVEALSVDFRYYDLGRSTLNEFTLLSLLNTSPITHLDRPFSWRAQVGVEDRFQTRVEGGIGVSQDLGDRIRVTQLLFASQRQSESGGGANVIVVGRPIQRLGLLADGKYTWTTTNRRRWILQAKLDYQIHRNWDFIVEHENQNFMEAKFQYSFLF